MLYFELEAPLKLLDDSQKGRLLSAILEYAHYGVIPEFGDPLLGMAWSFVKSDLDRDGERYRDTVHKKRISGITSDFKRNYAPKHGISPDDEEALQEYIRQRLSADVDECQPTTITSSNRTTEFDTDMELFGGKAAVRDLTIQVNQLVGIISDDRHRRWHNDTVVADWFNSVLARKLNSLALVDPSAPLPNVTEITPAVIEAYQLVSAILLSQNSKSFIPARGEVIPLSITTTQQRIFMEPIMFYIAVALLGIQLGPLVAYYIHRPRRFLPRMPLTIASVIAYVSASHATQNANYISSDKHARYGYGRFKGVDGKTHVGIEVEPLVVPLKVDNPEFKRRRRSLWLRRKQDPAQPKIWI